MYQQNKSSESKVKFRQASNRCKRVLEAAKLAYATKTKESITSQKLGSWDFWRIANSALNKDKSAIPPLFNGPEVLSSASDKAKLFAKNFSKNSNLDDSGISLPVFPSRTNLKLHSNFFFFDFQYGFRSSRSTADLLTVVSDRIARACNRSGATRAVALDISKAYDRVWHAGLLHKLKSHGISGQIFGLISSFLSNRRLRVVLHGKSSQEYPVNAGVPQGSILGPTLFLLYINDLPDDVICNIAIYADDTTLYSKCNQASDLWQQLELASELESDL